MAAFLKLQFLKSGSIMKKSLLLLGLVWVSGVMAKQAKKDDATFLEQVDHITDTRHVQKEGRANVSDVRVAVDIASGRYEEEADKWLWEKHPLSFGALCFVGGLVTMRILNSL